MFSMTGFARFELVTEEINFVCECRSVNHRYLDISLKLPNACKAFEMDIRALIKKHVQRGKIDMNCTYREPEQSAVIQMNQGKIDALLKVCESIAKKSSLQTTLNPIELLQWPEVITQEQISEDILRVNLLQTVSGALSRLNSARLAEGERIKVTLNEKVAAIKALLEAMVPNFPMYHQRQKDKLLEKLDTLRISIDEQRLEQELVYWLQKVDVTEEIDRLFSHLKEVDKLLTMDEPVGRRFDFLLQEFNREANTLASKACHEEVTKTALSLKVLVEQLREQVQNIE